MLAGTSEHPELVHHPGGWLVVLCSREPGVFLEGGACPTGMLRAGLAALAVTVQGCWLSARHMTGCLSQVSLAPRDTSPPRCSGRIPMAKPWTCGLAVSLTGAEIWGAGWAVQDATGCWSDTALTPRLLPGQASSCTSCWSGTRPSGMKTSTDSTSRSRPGRTM